MNWHEQRLCAFDLETTAPEPTEARIVTGCVALIGGGQPPEVTNWLADPGIEIPAEAASIHGITTERAHAEGRPAPSVIEEITTALAQVQRDRIPIVAMNARYDITVLDREARRHQITPLTDHVSEGNLLIVDPYVLDKQVDRYRKGRRTLTHLCEHYQVKLDGAHSSDADAIAAARVAWRIAEKYPAIRDMGLPELHKQQIVWAAEQAASLQEHLRRLNPGVCVEPAWPLVPFGGEQ